MCARKMLIQDNGAKKYNYTNNSLRTFLQYHLYVCPLIINFLILFLAIFDCSLNLTHTINVIPYRCQVMSCMHLRIELHLIIMLNILQNVHLVDVIKPCMEETMSLVCPPDLKQRWQMFDYKDTQLMRTPTANSRCMIQNLIAASLVVNEQNRYSIIP